jgi:hypothetical protein
VGANPRHQSRAERIRIMEIKIGKRCDIITVLAGLWDKEFVAKAEYLVRTC